METAPKYRDSDNTLLFKIVQKLSNSAGGLFAPRYGDSNNRLLQKWAKLLSGGSGPTPPPPGPGSFGVWTASQPAPGNDYAEPRDMAIDSEGNLLVVGYIFNGAGYDFYTLKYAAANGAVLWQVQYNNGVPAAANDEARSVAVDANNDVLVTGLSSNGANVDSYTVKYSGVDGSVIWQVRYNGPADNYDATYSIAVDSQGNALVTGISSNGSNYDIYTAKYAAANGALLWEVRYDGPATGDDYGVSVAVDSNDDVIVTGQSFNGTDDDIYTVKYAALTGAVIWEVRYDNGGNPDAPTKVAVDGLNNVIVTGFSGAGGSSEIYTAKYAAANGALIWEVRYHGPAVTDNAIGVGVAIDSLNNVVITGKSRNASNQDIYTAKYAAANGAIIWEVRYNGPSNFGDQGIDVAVDSSDNVIVTAERDNNSDGDIYTVKYAALTGAVIWEHTYNTGTGFSFPAAIVVAPNDNVAITGTSDNGVGYDIITQTYAAQ